MYILKSFNRELGFIASLRIHSKLFQVKIFRAFNWSTWLSNFMFRSNQTPKTWVMSIVRYWLAVIWTLNNICSEESRVRLIDTLHAVPLLYIVIERSLVYKTLYLRKPSFTFWGKLVFACKFQMLVRWNDWKKNELLLTTNSFLTKKLNPHRAKMDRSADHYGHYV